MWTTRKRIKLGGLTLLCGALALAGCDGELTQRALVLDGEEGVPGAMAGQGGGEQGDPGEMPGKTPVIERPDEEMVNPSMMDDVCKVINPGEAPMMRLTEREYRGATAAIFPDRAAVTSSVVDTGAVTWALKPVPGVAASDEKPPGRRRRAWP